MLLGKLIRSFMTKMLLLVGLMSGTASLAVADHCPPCHYKTIVSYECREVPYTVCVTRYDHCGRPYHAEVVRYRTVTVPVKRLVKVCY